MFESNFMQIFCTKTKTQVRCFSQVIPKPKWDFFSLCVHISLVNLVFLALQFHNFHVFSVSGRVLRSARQPDFQSEVCTDRMRLSINELLDTREVGLIVFLFTFLAKRHRMEFLPIVGCRRPSQSERVL